MAWKKSLFFRSKFIALPVCFVFWIELSFATNFYVAKNHPSASDSNPGTVDFPWKTIQHAAEILQPGDTAFIRTGIYSEPVYTTRSGNAVNGSIVFAAFPGEMPVIDGSIVSSGRTGFGITHSYIKLIGLEIRNWETGIWMEISGNIELTDCEVHHCIFGIGAANGVHDFVLNRVEIHHFDFYGFDASPSGGADCYNGTFNDCIAHTGRDREQNVDGFALGHGSQHDFVFNRCTTYDVFDGFDISSANTTINQCLAYNCWNGNYKLWQDNVKLINCIGHSCPGSNVELDWDEQPGTTWLINCTFFDAGTFTIWVENRNDRLRMYNCILAGGDNIGLAFEQMGVGKYEGDYNIFHSDNPYRAIAVAYTDEFTLDQVKTGTWTTYSGQDAHSIVENSAANLFFDSANFNLHLIETSPAVDHARSDLAPSIDFDGNPRPIGNGFDIGAYEYQQAVGIQCERPLTTESTILVQHYPNPFNSSVLVEFTLPGSAFVTLKIYNLLGEEVATLVEEHRLAGTHKLNWDSRGLASGVYLYRLQARDFVQVKKMVLLP